MPTWKSKVGQHKEHSQSGVVIHRAGTHNRLLLDRHCTWSDFSGLSGFTSFITPCGHATEFRRILGALLLATTGLVSDVDVRLAEPLLGKHFLEPVHLVFQRLAHPGVTTDKGHLGLLFRRQVDADVQAPELGRLKLDIGRFQVSGWTGT